MSEHCYFLKTAQDAQKIRTGTHGAAKARLGGIFVVLDATTVTALLPAVTLVGSSRSSVVVPVV